jgi:hypothetical protein
MLGALGHFRRRRRVVHRACGSGVHVERTLIGRRLVVLHSVRLGRKQANQRRALPGKAQKHEPHEVRPEPAH